MSTVTVRRAHNLGLEASKKVAEKLLTKLVDKFGGNYHCDGDNFSYKHTLGVDAVVEANDDELIVNVKLGMMTRSFAPKLESEMQRIFDENLV